MAYNTLITGRSNETMPSGSIAELSAAKRELMEQAQRSRDLANKRANEEEITGGPIAHGGPLNDYPHEYAQGCEAEPYQIVVVYDDMGVRDFRLQANHDEAGTGTQLPISVIVEVDSPPTFVNRRRVTAPIPTRIIEQMAASVGSKSIQQLSDKIAELEMLRLRLEKQIRDQTEIVRSLQQEKAELRSENEQEGEAAHFKRKANEWKAAVAFLMKEVNELADRLGMDHKYTPVTIDPDIRNPLEHIPTGFRQIGDTTYTNKPGEEVVEEATTTEYTYEVEHEGIPIVQNAYDVGLSVAAYFTALGNGGIPLQFAKDLTSDYAWQFWDELLDDD